MSGGLTAVEVAMARAVRVGAAAVFGPRTTSGAMLGRWSWERSVWRAEAIDRREAVARARVGQALLWPAAVASALDH